MTDIKNIPNNWEVKSIKDAFEIVKEKGSENSIPYLEIGDIDINSKTYLLKSKPAVKGCKIAKKGDLLISKVRPTRGAIVQIKEEIIPVSSAFTILRKKELFFDSFAFYFFAWNNEFHNYLGNNCSGSLYPTVSESDLTDYKILIPPYEEQRAIVSKIEKLLSELENGKQQLVTAQKQLKVYRQSLLKWAFQGKLTNKDLKEGDLPKDWKIVELMNLVEKISDGPFGSNLKSIDYVDSGVRVIRLENIGEMEFKDEYKTFVTPEKYETIKRHTVGKGDIIFSSFISDNIRSVILPDFIDKAINKADCFLIRADETKMRKKYLAHYFSTKAMQNQLVNQIHGATRPRINTTQLKASLIPFAPINEQDQIVSELESKLTVCDKIEETITQSMQQVETLRQSILKKAFEGKLI